MLVLELIGVIVLFCMLFVTGFLFTIGLSMCIIDRDGEMIIFIIIMGVFFLLCLFGIISIMYPPFIQWLMSEV